VDATRIKRERRRHPRAITSFSAVLTAATRQYSTRVINLSVGGALLDFSKILPDPPISVGDRLSLNIRCRGGAGPVLLEGVAVLWHLKISSQPLLAIQFDEVQGEDLLILEELIDEAMTEIHGRGLAAMR
jgi:hypothetical protein